MSEKGPGNITDNTFPEGDPQDEETELKRLADRWYERAKNLVKKKIQEIEMVRKAMGKNYPLNDNRKKYIELTTKRPTDFFSTIFTQDPEKNDQYRYLRNELEGFWEEYLDIKRRYAKKEPENDDKD